MGLNISQIHALRGRPGQAAWQHLLFLTFCKNEAFELFSSLLKNHEKKNHEDKHCQSWKSPFKSPYFCLHSFIEAGEQRESAGKGKVTVFRSGLCPGLPPPRAALWAIGYGFMAFPPWVQAYIQFSHLKANHERQGCSLLCAYLNSNAFKYLKGKAWSFKGKMAKLLKQC